MVVPVRGLSMDQIKLFNHLLELLLFVIWNHTSVSKLFELDVNIWWIELLMLNSNTWNHLAVCEQMSNIK